MITKKTLRILSIGEWDYAASGYLLSSAINETTNNVSVSVKWAQSPLSFPVGLVKPSDKQFIRLWLQSDVIHIHDAYNHIPKGLPSRPTIITWHGSKYRRNSGGNNNVARKNGWLQTVATVDLLLRDDSNQWMPDSRPVSSTNGIYDEFTVCHAPTSRVIKGTDEVIKACKYSGIKLSLVEKKPWNECMEEKSRCHVYVDQFILGYGCNAIEAWMYKQPVVANASDDAVIDKMLEIFGVLPFVQCNKTYKEIAESLVRLRDDNDYYNRMADIGYKHYLRFHSSESVAKRAIEYYHQAIDLFYRRTTNRHVSVPLPLGHDGNIVTDKGLADLYGGDFVIGSSLVYMGGNIGKETIIGPVTGRKYEYSGGVPFLVEEKDMRELLLLTLPAKKARGRRKQAPKPQPMFRRA